MLTEAEKFNALAMQCGIDFGGNHAIMRIKRREEVGIMKSEIRSTRTVSLPAMSRAMSVNNAVRFFFAQLFFGFIRFSPTPV